MNFTFEVISTVIYCLVGIVSLVMAYKNLSALGFLPFHERAAGCRWEDVGAGPQAVISTLMRLTGLGFAVVGLQLIALPLVGLMMHDSLPVLVGATTGIVFCLSLFLVNYRLEAATGAATPWRGALYAATAILVAIVLSFLHLETGDGQF